MIKTKQNNQLLIVVVLLVKKERESIKLNNTNERTDVIILILPLQSLLYYIVLWRSCSRDFTFENGFPGRWWGAFCFLVS